MISHPEFAPLRHGPIEVAEGSELQIVDLPMTQGGRLVGVVADDEGSPLPQHPVEARSQGQTFATTSDDDGRFVLARLPEGTYTVWRMRPIEHRQTTRSTVATLLTDAHVTEGEDTTLHLAPQGTGTIRGRVEYGEDAFPDDVYVELRPAGDPPGRPNRWVPVRDGTFEFVRVSPGAYEVHCNHYEQVPGSNELRSFRGHAEVAIEDGGVTDVALPVK